ncbi:hypothetical protein Psi02_04280 [Planotetraspora silvatica]|uniref:Uncharacterized protein n=1 Tax=Planotetraspora silvatica TaxID=234614 RepID=A0A8J3UED8_9ACTN|nr:hypothetical protein Psi02_04280 [Planotetraspora silvatica]
MGEPAGDPPAPILLWQGTHHQHRRRLQRQRRRHPHRRQPPPQLPQLLGVRAPDGKTLLMLIDPSLWQFL